MAAKCQDRTTDTEEQAAQWMRFSALLNGIKPGLCAFDANQRVVVCNDRYGSMYKLSRDQMRQGTTLREILDQRCTGSCFPDTNRDEYLERRRSIAAAGLPVESEETLRDGRIIEIRFAPMPDGSWVETHEDITDKRRTEEELQAVRDELEVLALHDPLTGLANRVKFIDRFEYDAARASRSGLPLSLLMVDIDHFKCVNDRHGHLAGDTCLKAVAASLKATVRKVDLVCRLGGEEFVVLLPETSAPQALVAGERVRAAVAAQPVRIRDDLTLPITVSVGAATEAGTTPISFDALLARADNAMYRAKTGGRNRTCA